MGVGFKMYNLMVMLGTGADYSVCGLFGVLVLSSILSVATIGLYKNRMLQRLYSGRPRLTPVTNSFTVSCFAGSQ